MITDFPVVSWTAEPRPLKELLYMLLETFKDRHQTALQKDEKGKDEILMWHGICDSMSQLFRLDRINSPELNLLKKHMRKFKPARTFRFWTIEFELYWNDAYKRNVTFDTSLYHYWWQTSCEGYHQRVKFINYLILKINEKNNK